MKRLGSGPRDSEDIKSHIFFKDVDWKLVIERRQQVPKPRIRKIEQNPAISIQSFLLEEEKLPSDIPNKLDQSSPKNSRPTTMPVEDPNKIAGWSYIKKANPHFSTRKF
jgi:hypothetical protein